MKSVSDQREEEGEKVLKMTDPFFAGSDINFRALIALLLGGIYYIVLHGETNKSTVSGIDINLEKDRKAISETIRQVISWAWEKSAVGTMEKTGK